MSAEVAAPELMSRAEAADYIGVKAQTLAVWACAGRYGLPFVKVGRLCRYRRSDLDAWLARRTRCPGEAQE
jgi:excisionase family DNA binding protein